MEATTVSVQKPNKLLEALNRAVDEIWDVPPLCVSPVGRPRPYPLFTFIGPTATDPEKGHVFISNTFDLMLESASFDKEALTLQAAILYYRPGQWIEQYSWNFNLPDLERYIRHAKGEIIQSVLGLWLRHNTSNASYALMSERISQLLRDSSSHSKPDLYKPTLIDLILSLLEDQSLEASEIIQQMIAGAMGIAKPGAVEEPELRKYYPQLFYRLWKEKIFDYSEYKQAIYALPSVIEDFNLAPGNSTVADAYHDLPSDFVAVLKSFRRSLAVELVEKVTQGDEQAAALLKLYNDLHGSEWLLRACAYIEEKKLGHLPPSNRWRTNKSPASAIVKLCMALHDPDEDKGQAIEFLRQYQAKTLLEVLPYAHDFQSWICEALGWQGAAELVRLVEHNITDEDLPRIAKEHFEAIYDTFHYHFPTRRKLLDQFKAQL
ncbi:MAG: hypothetical protein HXX08_19060 [Chloroflexi bacterium]|uniref:Uncharacterized protein n=1 Tax=Candidatus Chlorohelix allophototropha TaxID=3003348 RepID=A0A8T7M765_9CHLR|nr:hypothetical protein [Chloroflexota bacterium]WJW69864.1 hypothetical protein OZ401_003494 [Chloroflexota bacterium L227-S17]